MSSKSQDQTNPPQNKILDLGKGNGRMAASPLKNMLKEGDFYNSEAKNTQEYGFNFASDSRIFESGAKRDSAADKPRPDLLSPFATMRRGRVMELGARKYGIRNWEKGMPLSVFLSSANRHFIQFLMGETDEDHLAHCAFNIDAIMHGQEMIKRGVWPQEYDDLARYNCKNEDNKTNKQ